MTSAIFLAPSKIIGAGLATFGLAGAGIGIVFNLRFGYDGEELDCPTPTPTETPTPCPCPTGDLPTPTSCFPKMFSIGLAGAGIGIVFGSFIIGVSRNSDLSDDLFKICIMGFAL